MKRPAKLLNIDNNAKTIKGQKRGYKTAVLYLAPADLSGFEVCPMRSPGCTAACLNTAGQGSFTNVQQSRIAKTQWYMRDRNGFLAQLVKELASFIRKARAEGFTPVVRLNGTSDILWERVKVPYAAWKDHVGLGHGWGTDNDAPNVMAIFPDVQFYDYTKHDPKKRSSLPANYVLTFSVDERVESKRRALEALMKGWNVAVVFRNELPRIFCLYPVSYPVVNGDQDDLRFLDERGVIVGLKAKGRAKHDTTGFVRD